MPSEDSLEERLRSLPWDSLHTATGDDAREVPEALLRLAVAGDAEAIRRAYWRLDNHVVLQGTLSEAACDLVPFVLELLADRARPSRLALYDLLVEIARGEPPPGAGLDLREACRRGIRAGLPMIREDLLAAGTDPEIRDRALFALVAVEDDRTALADTLRRIPEGSGAEFAERSRQAAVRDAAR